MSVGVSKGSWWRRAVALMFVGAATLMPACGGGGGGDSTSGGGSTTSSSTSSSTSSGGGSTSSGGSAESGSGSGGVTPIVLLLTDAACRQRRRSGFGGWCWSCCPIRFARGYCHRSRRQCLCRGHEEHDPQNLAPGWCPPWREQPEPMVLPTATAWMRVSITPVVSLTMRPITSMSPIRITASYARSRLRAM